MDKKHEDLGQSKFKIGSGFYLLPYLIIIMGILIAPDEAKNNYNKRRGFSDSKLLEKFSTDNTKDRKKRYGRK